MNDDQALITMLRPLRDHFLVQPWYDEHRARVDENHHIVVDELVKLLDHPALSSGERALLEVALSVRAWKPVNLVTTLGAMSHAWQHHVLATLATRMSLTASNADGRDLDWVETMPALEPA